MLKFLLLLLSVATATATIIPADRVTTWRGNVGVVGGIPARATICANVSPGMSAAQVTAAIANCNSGETVFANAGTYNFSDSILINKGVTLRGAGPGITTFNFTGCGSSCGRGLIIFNANAIPYGYGTPPNIRTISSGSTTGSSSIVLNDATSVAVGCLLMIDQLNGTYNPTGGGSIVTIHPDWDGNCTWCSRAEGARAQGQVVEVTSVSGTTIGITPPLYVAYSRTPEAVVIPLASMLKNAGVENLTVSSRDSNAKANFHMNACSNCWIKNVEGDYCGGNIYSGDHVNINTSYRCEVRDSFFHDAYFHTAGQSDSDLGLFYKTSATLVENNILFRMHYATLINWGASGNVVGYNFSSGHFDSASPTALIADCTGHGAHPMFNLYEGNITGSIWGDSVWGSNSHGTFLRNWIKGTGTYQQPTGQGRLGYNSSAPQFTVSQQNRAVILDSQSSYYNVIGNVLGTQGFTAPDRYVAAWPASRTYSPDRYMFSFGYGGGGGGDGGGATGDPTLAETTIINHGNWDSATSTQKWDSGIADHIIPDSYYLAAKPAFFGSLTWPPFNPATGSATMAITNIPAGYRSVNGTPPPNGTPSPTPTATATATASPQPTPSPTPTPSPPESFSQGINFGGGAVTIDGHLWQSQSASGIQTAQQSYTATRTWSPTVDVATKSMLDDGIYCTQCSIYFSLPLVSRNYNVYVWTTESHQDNYRQFNLKFEGTQVAAALGQLSNNGWYRYGPYPVTMTDGALDVDLEFTSGDIVLNGLEIWTVNTSSPTPTATPSATVTATPTPTVTPTPAGTSSGIVEVRSQEASMTAVNANSAIKAYPGQVKAGQFLLVVGVAKGGLDQTAVSVYDTRSTIFDVSFGTSSTTTTTNKITFIAWGTVQTMGADTIVVNPTGTSSSFSWTQHVFEGTAMRPVDPRFLTVDEAIALVDTNGGDTQGTMVASTAGNASDTITISANALIVGVMAHTNTTAVSMIAGEGYTKSGGAPLNSTYPAHAAIFRLPATAGDYTPNIDYSAGQAADKEWTLQTYSFRPAATDFPIGGAAATRTVNRSYNPRR